MDAPSAPGSRASDSAEPLTAELSRLHVTVSRRFLEKLETARAALSHGQNGGNVESILEAGLDLILKRHAARLRLGIVCQEGRAQVNVKGPGHLNRQALELASRCMGRARHRAGNGPRRVQACGRV